jgi:hypothetical protein
MALIESLSVAGLLAFLFRQTIWTRFLQPLVSRKPKPILRFNDNTDVIRLKVFKEKDLMSRVEESMQRLRAKYPFKDVPDDPYYDFSNFIRIDNIGNKQIYNKQLEAFFKSHNVACEKIYTGKFFDSCLVPVNIEVHNVGNVSCGKMTIELSIDKADGVYTKDARHEIQDTRLKPPVLWPSNCIPCLSIESETYDYAEWNLAEHIPTKTKYSVDYLIQKDKNTTAIPTLYIDTRVAGKVLVDWTIMEQNNNNPIKGEAVIWIE